MTTTLHYTIPKYKYKVNLIGLTCSGVLPLLTLMMPAIRRKDNLKQTRTEYGGENTALLLNKDFRQVTCSAVFLLTASISCFSASFSSLTACVRERNYLKIFGPLRIVITRQAAKCRVT